MLTYGIRSLDGQAGNNMIKMCHKTCKSILQFLEHDNKDR